MEDKPSALQELQGGLAFLGEKRGKAVLRHYGIPGMKWGVRRSRDKLAKLRGNDGEEIGSIGAKSRAAAKKLKNMATGEVLISETDDGGPKILVKQKDGSFKQVEMSVDAKNVLRTTTKDPSEMSTREMNDAVKRAQAVESYNKIFNPAGDPNSDLRAKVQALELQQRYSSIQAQMNPSRAQRVAKFASDLGPAFNAFQMVDKATNRAISENLNSMVNEAFAKNKGDKSGTTPKVSKVKMEPTKEKKSRKEKKPPSSPERVYTITDL